MTLDEYRRHVAMIRSKCEYAVTPEDLKRAALQVGKEPASELTEKMLSDALNQMAEEAKRK